jgi:hypothetical protein
MLWTYKCVAILCLKEIDTDSGQILVDVQYLRYIAAVSTSETSVNFYQTTRRNIFIVVDVRI